MYVYYGDEDSYKNELEEILIKEAKKAEEEREKRRLEQLAKSKE
jgi:hypothetical protein